MNVYFTLPFLEEVGELSLVLPTHGNLLQRCVSVSSRVLTALYFFFFFLLCSRKKQNSLKNQEEAFGHVHAKAKLANGGFRI